MAQWLAVFMVDRSGTFAELPTWFQNGIEDDEETRQQTMASDAGGGAPFRPMTRAATRFVCPAERQWRDASEIRRPIAQQVLVNVHVTASRRHAHPARANKASRIDREVTTESLYRSTTFAS
jgi:hypothetical protein